MLLQLIWEIVNWSESGTNLNVIDDMEVLCSFALRVLFTVPYTTAQIYNSPRLRVRKFIRLIK